MSLKRPPAETAGLKNKEEEKKECREEEREREEKLSPAKALNAACYSWPLAATTLSLWCCCNRRYGRIFGIVKQVWALVAPARGCVQQVPLDPKIGGAAALWMCRWYLEGTRAGSLREKAECRAMREEPIGQPADYPSWWPDFVNTQGRRRPGAYAFFVMYE